MRRVFASMTIMVSLLSPAFAFDFTARSFGPLFDHYIRIDQDHRDDRCTRWDRDGGVCDYGPEQDFAVEVLDSPVHGHPAYLVELNWMSRAFFEQHRDASLVFTGLCQPRVDPARRAAMLERIAPRPGPDGKLFSAHRSEILDGVEYQFAFDDQVGVVTLNARDISLPDGVGTDRPD